MEQLVVQPQPHVHTEAEIAAARHRLAFSNMLRIGLFALGVGVLGAWIFDWHRHTCSGCGRQWRHLGAFNFNEERPHLCPSCSTPQWRKDA